MIAYATTEDCAAYGCTLPEDSAEQWLHRASRDIDTLTFNRIVAKGFDNLTPFQREIVTEVCCRLAVFDSENAELLDSPLSSFSINGVSAQFGGGFNSIAARQGVVLPERVGALLEQTGLCVRTVSR